MKVSIIIPVYNAAAVIKPCLDCLAAQSYPDIELCFVDDASNDGSAVILKRFAATCGREVIIHTMRHNSGVASARNAGLDISSGELLAFVDADDNIAPDAIEKAVNAMEDADIVGWDWILQRAVEERRICQPVCRAPKAAVIRMMEGVMRWNLWLFLSRRSLWEEHGIRFLDGKDMGEDMMVMLKLMSKARKFVQINEPLYRYNAMNVYSVSRVFDKRRRDEVSGNVTELESYFAGTEYDGYMDYLKLNVKLPLLVTGQKSDYETWGKWFTESDHRIWENDALPKPKRMLQWCASRRLWIAVRLYAFILSRRSRNKRAD